MNDVAVKKLFVFPGAGNPTNGQYFKVYETIRAAAEEKGYEDIQILTYPGHISSQNDNEELYLESSVEASVNTLELAEKTDIKYDVICRSYGCMVFMKIMLTRELKLVHKIVLWGPSPYCNAYKAIMRDEDAAKKIGISKGVRLSSKIFSSADPFEIQLMQHTGNKKIYIGTGELDNHCKPVFLHFLDAYLDYDKRFSYSVIRGVEHEIDYPNEDYLNFLFPD